MNPKTNRRTTFAQQLPEAEQGRVPLSGYPENIQNLYGAGMTQAFELAKSSFSAAVCMNSCLMDFYRHFFWYPLGMEYWFEAQKESFANWMELGAQSLGGFASESATAAYRRRPNQQRTSQEQEEMEDGMDVAVE